MQYDARISGSSLRELYKDAKEAPGRLQIELRRGVKSAGQQVVRAVQAEASTFSKQIPSKIKLQVSFAAKRPGVKVVAIDPSGEAGALNNKDKAGTFRHPVFAHPQGRRNVRTRWAALNWFKGVNQFDWRWVSQEAHPFFHVTAHPAALQASDEIRKVMDDVARQLGFH